MKFMMAAVVAVFMGTTLTSCLDSDGGTYSDGFGWYEVSEGGIFGGVILRDDNRDITLVPQNPSKLLYSSGTEYPKHIYAAFSFPEGDPGFVDGKTSYDVIIDNWSDVFVKNLCNPDTLTHTNSAIRSFEEGYTWASHSYLTLEFTAPRLTNTSLEHFDAYPVSAEGNVLYMKFNQNQEVKSGTELSAKGMVSFKLPHKMEIISKFPELEFFGSSNDSVYVVVTADTYGNEDTKLESKKLKVRLRQ